MQDLEGERHVGRNRGLDDGEIERIRALLALNVTLHERRCLGDHVRGLIGKLTALGTSESLEEINRLLELPTLEKIKRHLLSRKQEVIQYTLE